MAAAAITISRSDRDQIVTTTDAALTIVNFSADIAEITVQMTSAAGGYLQLEGAVQGDAVGTAVVELAASGSATLVPEDCGVGAGLAGYFGVARVAAGAVFRVHGRIR